MTAVVDHGTTRDGLIQLRRRWRPAGDAKAAMLMVHGLGEHSGRYDHVVDFLTARGFDVARFDLRGHGNSGGPRGHSPAFDTLLDDIDRFAEVAADALESRPVLLYGHSLGGKVATVELRFEPSVPRARTARELRSSLARRQRAVEARAFKETLHVPFARPFLPSRGPSRWGPESRGSNQDARGPSPRMPRASRGSSASASLPAAATPSSLSFSPMPTTPPRRCGSFTSRSTRLSSGPRQSGHQAQSA